MSKNDTNCLNLGSVEGVYTPPHPPVTEGASQKIVLVQASQEFSKNGGVHPLYAFCVREYVYASRINFIFD